MEDPDFLKETKDVPQIGLPPLSAWDRPETSPSPLKNAQGLPLPRILALATINMLRDGANEIYLEECRMLRYELYALCVLYWEAFSLHSKHWGWIMARYFQVTWSASTPSSSQAATVRYSRVIASLGSSSST